MENFQILLILMVVIYLTGHIFRKLKLPVIFGELLWGILVGPLVFNLINPEAEIIKILAELWIFFLMLHAGLENDPHELFKASKKSLLISLWSFLLPFGLWFSVSNLLLNFNIQESLFIGIAISTTSIAICTRLLKDINLKQTKIANIIMSSAIITDIISLIVFSIILWIIDHGWIDIKSIGFMLLKVIWFFWVVIFGGMKISKHLDKILKDKWFTFSLISALILGLWAELIWLHFIIWAFLAWLFIREEVIEEKIFNKIEDRIYGLSYSFLWPIFFASLAFYIDFQNIWANIWLLIIIFLLAFLWKWIWAFLTAKLQKIPTRNSLTIWLIMNSRGAVDLIIISLWLQQWIISQELFSVLIAVVFTTTFLWIISAKSLRKKLNCKPE